MFIKIGISVKKKCTLILSEFFFSSIQNDKLVKLKLGINTLHVDKSYLGTPMYINNAKN